MLLVESAVAANRDRRVSECACRGAKAVATRRLHDPRRSISNGDGAVLVCQLLANHVTLSDTVRDLILKARQLNWMKSLSLCIFH